MWSIGLGFAVVSPASAADPTAIRDILDEPSVYHLRQVVLQGRVRNVQPLDPYKLPAGTTCYGAYLFYLEDETASINVAVFGLCGIPTVKDPDVEEGTQVQLQATIQAPSHGGWRTGGRDPSRRRPHHAAHGVNDLRTGVQYVVRCETSSDNPMGPFPVRRPGGIRRLRQQSWSFP
jgi:hypothetical protein